MGQVGARFRRNDRPRVEKLAFLESRKNAQGSRACHMSIDS